MFIPINSNGFEMLLINERTFPVLEKDKKSQRHDFKKCIVVSGRRQIRSLTFLILSLTEDFVQFPMIQPGAQVETSNKGAFTPCCLCNPACLWVELFDSLSLQF